MIIRIALMALLFCLATTGCNEHKTLQDDQQVYSVDRPAVSSVNAHYTGNRAPLQPLHFIKLPIASIQPRGWLKKYLLLQQDGLTGKLNDLSIWLEKKNNAWYNADGTGDRGWEELPYWLKGYGNLGYILGNKKIIDETKIWIEKILASQRSDGSFGPMAVVTAYLNNNKGDSPDLWPNMIVLWCMQSYYDYSADPRVISFMTKYFRWQQTIPDSKFLRLYWEKSRGGDNLYSVYWLYNRTGEKWLLDLARRIHDHTADWMQKDSLPNWHNVNIAQCFREPATYYMLSGDSAHLRATYNDFFLIRNLYGQVPGGMFGADENARKGYDDPRQAVETCGMVEQMASDEILAGITGDPFWADHCENVAFNTYPAAVMPDFKALRYLTAPNMVVSDSRNHSPGIENSGPDLMMNPFISRCCQHNHAQGWPYFAEHLWMATPDNGLAAILYNDCETTATVGAGTKVHINERTNYPFDDKIILEISCDTAAIFPLYLRIPSWCSKAMISINGETLQQANPPSTYTVISRTWTNKDVVELSLPMEISVKEWKKNKNSVSVNYGPLSFSLKISEEYRKKDGRAVAAGAPKWQENVQPSEWPSFEIFPSSAWNYGLLIDSADHSKSFSVHKKPWPADDFPFTQESTPIEITAKGKQITSWITDQYGLCGLLPQSPVDAPTEAKSLTLIPMGAARLRIASFPVILR